MNKINLIIDGGCCMFHGKGESLAPTPPTLVRADATNAKKESKAINSATAIRFSLNYLPVAMIESLKTDADLQKVLPEIKRLEALQQALKGQRLIESSSSKRKPIIKLSKEEPALKQPKKSVLPKLKEDHKELVRFYQIDNRKHVAPNFFKRPPSLQKAQAIKAPWNNAIYNPHKEKLSQEVMPQADKRVSIPDRVAGFF
jgi:hypothetical protein